MPFQKRCRITLTNIGADAMTLYYQINYTLTEVPENAAYFHAQFRRTNPLPYKQDYTILEGVKGRGHYVGTYMAWQVNNNNWWGEVRSSSLWTATSGRPSAEPVPKTIFCGSYDFDVRVKHGPGAETTEYQEFTTPYAGMPQVIQPDGHYVANTRFGMYRWHIMDPIRSKRTFA